MAEHVAPEASAREAELTALDHQEEPYQPVKSSAKSKAVADARSGAASCLGQDHQLREPDQQGQAAPEQEEQ